jgi:DNA-binding LacI/PurR family transcriptional regulator
LLDVPGEGEEETALVHRARSRAYAGSVLFEGFYLSDELLARLAATRHPCVVTAPEHARPVPHVTTVIYDADGGMREAARHLVGLGHRRIAVLNDAGLSCGAFLDEARLLGAPVAPERAASVLPSVENAAEVVRRFLSLPERQRPTALFARKDVLALAALREARRAGLTIPHDLSVVGFDDTHLNRLADPPLTAVSLDCPALGELLADALCQRIERPEPSPITLRHPARLVVRASTAAPPVPNSGQKGRTNP